MTLTLAICQSIFDRRETNFEKHHFTSLLPVEVSIKDIGLMPLLHLVHILKDLRIPVCILRDIHIGIYSIYIERERRRIH